MQEKMKSRQITPYQKFIVISMSFIGSMNIMSLNNGSTGEMIRTEFPLFLGQLIGGMVIYGLVILILMLIYNKFIHPKINVKSEKLKKIWYWSKIVIGLWIAFNMLIFVYLISNTNY